MRRSSDYENIERPVVALQDEYPAGFVDPRHRHRRAQLLYASSGIMSVTTDRGNFVLPPQRALWLPGGTEHEASCRGPVSLRTLYVEPDAHPDLPETCRVIEVSDLLRALILRAMTFPAQYDQQGHEGRVMRLILDEIAIMPTIPLLVPVPQDQRLARICREILQMPSIEGDLDHWALKVGMSRRTFTRLFREETSMSFAAWRQQVRLLEALSRLAVGHPITTVAFDVGYNSSSAFTAMFHRTFGMAPSQYFGKA